MEEVYKVIGISRLVPAKSLLLLFIYRPLALVRLYGARGLVYYFFGSQMTWRTEAKVIGTLLDDDANHFKNCVQDQCAMISVAAAIVAQKAITRLGFAELIRTHWVARALFLFSVLASRMAVYYATTQQRIVGRLHQPAQIRGWIRGHLPSSGQRLGARRQCYLQHQVSTGQDSREVVRELAQRCFCPSATSVLTVSAPQIFLSSSLHSLLLGVGVYFGFVWTRVVDKDARHSGSRNITIAT